MKKILFSVFAMAAMLFATSCSQEEDFNLVADGTEVNVSFSVELPQIATRTYSDGLTAKTLEYAFYDAADVNASKNPLLKGKTTLTDKTATVNVNLATGKTYNILFWAQKEGNTNYAVDWNAQTLTVDYSKGSALANNEENDAFYAFVDDLKVNGALTETVKLYRPFAQINLGTSDYAAAAEAGLTVDRSAMKAAVLPNVLYFDGGDVEGEVTVEFTANTIARDEEFPVKNGGYEYLEMNYVLVGATKSTIDCEFYIYETGKEKCLDPTIVVSNVPVQRNYRTNIYGALLTDPATFNVEIKPAYEDEDNNVEIWDSKAEPVTPENGVYVVNNASELAWVAQQLSAKNITEGTIQLAADIYLDGSMWTPINIWNPENAGVITFDGQGHTINGMTVKGGADLGFFGNVAQNLVIKNVTFTSPVIESTSSFVGAVFGKQYANVELENINVVDGQFSTSAKKGIKVAGLIGQSNAGQSGTTLAVNNCKVEGSTFTAYHSACGLIGYVADNAATITNCQSNNNTFYYSDDRSLGGHPWANYCTPGSHNDGPVDATCTTEGNKGFLVVANGVMKNDAGEYEISNANGMFWFADQVNEANNSFAGKTVKLIQNINLNNQAWEPVGQTGYTQFLGVFDGNNKTISNLTINNTDASANCATGLFGWIERHGNDADYLMAVKNLNIEGATINGHHNVATIAGYLIGTIENCHVTGAAIECTHANDEACGDKAGVIAGIAAEANALIKDCTATNSTVKAGRDAGQIVGACIIGKVENCTATNVVVSATGDCTGNNVNNGLIGRIN